MEQVYDDALWKTLEKLKSSGKVRFYGIALGPAIGWLYEGMNCVRERDVTSVQHIYNMLEQHPGHALHDAATEAGKDTMFLIRVTHSSGMLEGKYTADTVFPPTDHRSHRPRSWLLNGIKKIDKLRFLETSGRTLGQARTTRRIRESARMPGVDSRRSRQDRQSPFGKLRRRRRTAEIQRNDGAIERNGRGLRRSHSERSEESPSESLITLDELCDPNFDCEIPHVRSG